MWTEIAQVVLGIITGLVGGGFALYQLGAKGKSLQEELSTIKRLIELEHEECVKIDYRLTLIEQKLIHKDELSDVQNQAQFYKLSKDIKSLSAGLYQVEQFLSKHHGYAIRTIKKTDQDTNF